MDITYDARLLKAARIAVGMDQKELAERAGVSRDTVQKLESDATSVGRRLYMKVITAFEDAGIEWLPAAEGKGEGFRFNALKTTFSKASSAIRPKD